MRYIRKTALALYLIATSGLCDAVRAPAQSLTSGEDKACSASSPRIDLGFTLTHAKVYPADPAQCGQSHGASLRGADNIIAHYKQVGVEEAVQGDLKTMAENGARAARVIVWYRHAEDARMAAAASRSDPLGYLVASDGRLSQVDIDNLHAFARDLEKDGYKRLYINLAPMGLANPRTSARECRAGTPNCYNPDFLGKNWSVAEQVISSFRASKHGIDIVFDLASESCFVSPPAAEIERNLSMEVRFMLEHYKEKFGNGGFVVSCSGANERRALAGLSMIEAIYKELEMKPAAIDLHVYNVNPVEVREILLAGNATAKAVGVPFDIAETYAYNSAIMSAIGDLANSGQLPSLRTLLMFPRTSESACDIDVPPPYDLAEMRRLLGAKRPCGGSN